MLSIYNTSVEHSKKMTQNFELTSNLNFSLAKISQLLQVDSSIILRFKYDTKALLNNSQSSQNIQNLPEGEAEFAACWLKDGEVDDNLLKHSFNLADSPLCQKAWENAEYHQKPLLINKRNDLLKSTTLRDPCLGFATKSKVPLLMIPIMSNQSSNYLPKVLGFLIFHQNQPRVWHNSEIELAQWTALNTGIAIIYHETLSLIQSLSDDRKIQQNRLTSGLQTMLFQKRGETIEELKRNNELKDKLIARLSDELNNPLTNMKMAIQNLKNMLQKGVDPPKIERSLNILETECTKEIDLVQRLLSIQELQSNQVKLQLQTLDCKPMIESLARSFTDKWASKGLSFTTSYHNILTSKSSIPLTSDHEKLKKIFLELLQNAGKFSQSNSQVEIKITNIDKNQPQCLKIEVKNIGASITSDEQKQIFENFFQGSNVPHASNRGMGIGLTMVKYLVELLKGTVEVNSFPLADTSVSETCFTITLPQSQ